MTTDDHCDASDCQSDDHCDASDCQSDDHCDASDCPSDGALHAKQVLAPQGHVLLVASRPTGIHEARFRAFRRAELSLLTVAQQVHLIASDCI